MAAIVRRAPLCWGVRFLADFFAHLEHARSVSAHTLRAYRTDLAQFAESLSPEEQAAPETLTTPALKAHLAGLLDRGLSRSTVLRHSAALRTYFKYLLAEGFASNNPAESLRLPKRGRHLPQVLSEAQMKRLLAAPVGDGVAAVRDRAILETLYSTGLRVSELVGLDLTRLDLEDGSVRVLGKGRRERQAYLGSFAVAALQAWLPRRRTKTSGSADHAVFQNLRGGRLTDRSVRRVLDRYIIKADLPRGVTPHTLRHSFATHLLTAGAGLKEVQELLGHLHLSSTQVYTHVAPAHLKKIYDAAHPRALHPNRAAEAEN